MTQQMSALHLHQAVSTDGSKKFRDGGDPELGKLVLPFSLHDPMVIYPCILYWDDMEAISQNILQRRSEESRQIPRDLHTAVTGDGDDYPF